MKPWHVAKGRSPAGRVTRPHDSQRRGQPPGPERQTPAFWFAPTTITTTVLYLQNLGFAELILGIRENV